MPIRAAPNTQTTVAAKPAKTFVCPLPAALFQKKHIWQAIGGWRSYSTSFTSEALNFLGAQWKGSNVGKIFCVYGGQPGDFPITIQRANLTFKPKGGNWTLKDGYMDCQGADPQQCPYVLRVVKAETMGEIYQSIRLMKP